MRDDNESSLIRMLLNRRQETVRVLRQNGLLRASKLASFAKDRGIDLRGSTTGLPKLVEMGLIRSDDTDADGQLWFHPFRIYPLYNILDRYQLRIAPTALINIPERSRSLV